MEYSYKFRIYPNAAQENLIQRTFGCSRFVFNHFLAERMEQYEKTGIDHIMIAFVFHKRIISRNSI